MEDMTAFERQVGEEMRQEMGAAPDFDPASVAHEAATDAEMSRWPVITRWLPGGSVARSERRLSVFSAVKLVAAAAIVALFGGFLMAGVIDAPERAVAPGVSNAEPTPEVSSDVSRVAGRVHFQPGQEATMEAGDDRIMYRGALEPITLEVDDPRLDASGAMAFDYDVVVGGLAQEIHSGRWAIENEVGSWVGEERGFHDPDRQSIITLRGGGGYEGLTALLFLNGELGKTYDDVVGLVFPGEMPPRPDRASVSPEFDPATADPVGDVSTMPGSFDGVLVGFSSALPGTYDESFTERMRFRDHWNYSELEADDPRISGAWSIAFTADTFIGAVGEAVFAGSTRIDNAEGSWSGPTLAYMDDKHHRFVLLDGSDAYEGLQAMLFLEGSFPTTVQGVVFPAPMPDLPEIPPATE